MKYLLTFFSKESEDDDVKRELREALSAGDVEKAEQIVADNKESYPENIEEAAFRIAVQEACYQYVDEHYDDVELNDTPDGFCSYLQETDNSEIIDLLFRLGACRAWEDYEGCSFAMETLNGSVLSFDSSFQRQVFEKLIQKLDLSESKVAEMLDSGEAEDYELPDDLCCSDISNLQEACDTLLASSDEDSVDLEDFAYTDEYVDGWTLMELIENLGWNCHLEGDEGKFETSGVYFID